MLERTFIRMQDSKENDEWKNPQQLNIGVTGLGQSVGTTFVATSLAFYFVGMGNSVTFTQCLTPSRCNSLLYDATAMDQRFSNRQFHDVYRLILENKPARGKKNMEKGINWILPTPWILEQGKDLDGVQQARLIQSAKGEICIFDFAAEQSWDSHLPDMDKLIIVADPMPSKLIRHKERFQRLKTIELSGIAADWVVNRSNSGVSRRQIAAYLKNRKLLWIPQFAPELFYADEFACRFSWENKEIKSKLLDIFTKFSQ
ncbi:hypothetical protein AALA22_13460 [Anaerovoracaceae bacterium 41-7]|jgi:hypothetical protein|uniref:Uncharacterized protein n=1 Tax=Anaerotruncus colihominis TaxID=169435 RepID=A0A845QGD8_9FIRM|nr:MULTISPECIES: hypothetical protein [Clostridia]MCI9476052.1 hypothetical protein [Emergencia sp.]MCI9639080.1 hypothetical protein [Emergencia sp.]NBH60426.1 hypothetical protein [Anaerotruncus colihominis]NCE99234.1 hypothetical protein [Emergencia sp. 1XD21-10]NCF01080.1 hypothetical protein [Anaerotruncus sp. 80]